MVSGNKVPSVDVTEKKYRSERYAVRSRLRPPVLWANRGCVSRPRSRVFAVSGSFLPCRLSTLKEAAILVSRAADLV